MPNPTAAFTITPSGTGTYVSTSAALTGYAPGGIQTVNPVGHGGTFTLAFNGSSASSAIPIGAPAAVVQAALQALSTVGAGNASVVGWGPYQVTFTGTLATSAQPAITVNTGGLSGSYPTTPATAGTSAETQLEPAYTGTWTTVPSYGYKYVSQGGIGANYATWHQTGLSAGVYSFSITPYYAVIGATGFTPSVSQVYRVYDGAALDNTAILRGVVTLNPTVQGGVYDEPPKCPVLSGYCASGTLWLVLADDTSDGNSALAYHARISPALTGGAGVYTNSWPSGTSDRSVYVRFALSATCDNTQQFLFNYGWPWNGAALFQLYLLNRQVCTHAGFTSHTGTATLTQGTTNAVVAVCAGGNTNTYLNGSATPDITAADGPSTGATPFLAGIGDALPNSYVGGYEQLQGSVFPAGIWSRGLTLTETEILGGATVYHFADLAGLNGGSLLTGLVSWYDDNSGVDKAGTTNLWTAPVKSDTVTTSGAVTVVKGGGPPTYRINRSGTILNGTFGPLVWFNPTSTAQPTQTFAQHGINIPVIAGDVVTLSFERGVYNCGGGTVNDILAVTNGPVTNNVGVHLLSGVPNKSTLKVGYNVDCGNCYGGDSAYANIAKVANGLAGFGVALEIATVLNSHGDIDPTLWVSAGSPAISMLVTGSINDVYTPAGPPGYPPGNYTVMWDSTDLAAGQVWNFWGPFSQSAVGTLVAQSTGHLTNNYVTLTLPAQSGFLTVNFSIFYKGGAYTNLRVYGPEVTDPLHAPVWSPTMMGKLSGVNSIRGVFLNNGLGSLVDESDYVNTNATCYNTPSWQKNYIASISPYYYSPSNPYSLPGQIICKVTYTAPHNFKRGHRPETPAGNIMLSLKAGGTDQFWVGGGEAYPVPGDPYSIITAQGHFDFNTWTPPGGGGPGTNYFHWTKNVYFTPMECASFCNALSADFMWSLQFGMSDACLASQAAILAANLVGKLHVEFSCEVWNSTSVYGFAYSRMVAQWPQLFFSSATETSLTFDQAHALLAGHAYSIIKAAYVAAGRPNDCVHCYGSQEGGTGHTSDGLAYLATHDPNGVLLSAPYTGHCECDAVMLAPYANIMPYDGIDVAAVDTMTLEQSMDWGELYWANASTLANPAAAHRSLIAASAFPTAALEAYEASPGCMRIGRDLAGINTTRANALGWISQFHPRYRLWTLGYLSAMQANGYTRAYINSYTGPLTIDVCVENYCIHHGIMHDDGYGDGSDSKTNNSPALVTSDGSPPMTISYTAGTGGTGILVSPAGAAIRQWMAPPPPPTPAAKTVSPLRRQIQRPGYGRRFY